MKNKNFSWAAGVILFVSIIAGGWLRFYAAKPQGLLEFWSHDYEYYTLGVQLADEGVFRMYPGWDPTAARMPLYSAWIAWMRWVRPGPQAVRYFQALLDTLLIAVVGLAGSLLAGLPCAALAAFFYAFSSIPLKHVPYLMTESFFSFLVVNTALAVLFWVRRPGSIRRSAIAGLFLGASLLCRSTLFALPVMIALYFLKHSGARSLRKSLPIFMVLTYVGLIPWIWRNARIFGEFIPFESGSPAVNLWEASIGITEAMSVTTLIAKGGHSEFLSKMLALDESAMNRELKRQAVANIVSQPFRYLVDCFKRLAVLWRNQAIWLLLALGIFLIRPPPAGWIIVFIFVAYFSIHALMAAVPRYAVPAFGLVAVLAALGVFAAAKRIIRFPLHPAPECETVLKRYLLCLLCFIIPLVLSVPGFIFLEAYRFSEPVNDVFPLDPPMPFERFQSLKQLNDKGVDMAARGRFYEADKELSRALELEPEFGEARLNRAVIRSMRGNGSRAEEDYAEFTLFFEGTKDRRVLEDY